MCDMSPEEVAKYKFRVRSTKNVMYFEEYKDAVAFVHESLHADSIDLRVGNFWHIDWYRDSASIDFESRPGFGTPTLYKKVA